MKEGFLGRGCEAADVADVVGHVGVDLEVGECGGGEPAFLALVSRLEGANNQVKLIWVDI